MAGRARFRRAAETRPMPVAPWVLGGVGGQRAVLWTTDNYRTVLAMDLPASYIMTFGALEAASYIATALLVSRLG